MQSTFQLVAVLAAFFGGILCYVLNLLCFESKRSNILKIFSFVVACIPVVGLITYGVIYLYNCLHYDKTSYRESSAEAIVRDTKLNRFLFNDVDWKERDNLKKFSKES